MKVCDKLCHLDVASTVCRVACCVAELLHHTEAGNLCLFRPIKSVWTLHIAHLDWKKWMISSDILRKMYRVYVWSRDLVGLVLGLAVFWSCCLFFFFLVCSICVSNFVYHCGLPVGLKDPVYMNWPQAGASLRGDSDKLPPYCVHMAPCLLC